MYVVPDGIIELFEDVPLSPSYEDTLYFSTESEKDDFFSNTSTGYGSKLLTRAMPVTYSREQRGFVRIEETMRKCKNASYMRFKNTAFENKWIYAFVTDVEYINNGTTQINFEIDYVMTWMGTFTLAQCYIERQHTLGDGIGANICDEGLDCGEYVAKYVNRSDLTRTYHVCLACTEKPDTSSMLSEVHGIATGLYLVCLPTGAMDDFLTNYLTNHKPESIINITMIPDWLSNALEPSSAVPKIAMFDGNLKPALHKPLTTDDFNGYVPKNHKLYTYPYTMLCVHNSEGSMGEFKYEYFGTLPDEVSSGVCAFLIEGCLGAQTEMRCEPIAYMGQGQDCHEYSLSMKNFVEVAWGSDAFKAFIAQNKSSLAVNLANNIATLGTTAMLSSMGVPPQASAPITYATTTALSTVANGFYREEPQTQSQRRPDTRLARMGQSAMNDVRSTMAKMSDIARQPPQAQGHYMANVSVAMRDKDFYFIRKQITKNYAMMIDNYFTMFGYAVKQVNVPNMNARPYFTYVKTIGCNVHGALPSAHAREIEQAFDKGIRFWNQNTGGNIGNYSLDNSPR